MKIVRYIIIVIALGLIVFNATKIDVGNPFEGESQVAAIGIAASGCAILLMFILQVSLKVKQKSRR